MPKCFNKFEKNINMKFLAISITVTLMISCGEITEVKQSSSNPVKSVSDISKIRKKTSKQNAYVSKSIDSIRFSKYSFDSLLLKRNEIFARYGYIFKSKKLQEYFRKFDWYAPRYNNVNKYLNDIDKQNIKIIRKIEHFKKEFNKKRVEYFKSLPDMQDSKYGVFKGVKDENYKFWGMHQPDSMHGNCIRVNGKKIGENCIFLFIADVDCFPPCVSVDYFYIDIYDLKGNFIHESPLLFARSSWNDASYKIFGNKIFIKEKQFETTDSVDEQSGAYIDKYICTKDKIFFMDTKKMTVTEIKNTSQ